ncbi:MarR family winged helix-turn-helix transcriptional regulator [Solidesulfovibrio sp.]|uniref:MarR family winged helix-turn-helix transcriptional regulator n=1 Tax=Solidesulfovibrio sp. TaxID=2910990 RepID=UPI002607028F|nr:MarR family winged helix-turn-helix transcriptional regulator [Solidesulfovibrio sp.]
MDAALPDPEADTFKRQATRLQDSVENLFSCCQARIALQSERFGLPPAALRAVLALGESRYLAPGELGRRLGVTKSRVTAVTTGLLRQGLIEKHPDPADARVTLLSLTPAGKRMREDIRTFMVALFQAMLDRVEPDRREAVLSSLEVLRHCMESARADIKP